MPFPDSYFNSSSLFFPPFCFGRVQVPLEAWCYLLNLHPAELAVWVVHYFSRPFFLSFFFLFPDAFISKLHLSLPARFLLPPISTAAECPSDTKSSYCRLLSTLPLLLVLS